MFDRNTIKCRGEQDSGDKEPLVGDNHQSRIAKMEGSVLPFFLTNLLCLGFSLLSLAPWKAGLVSSISNCFLRLLYAGAYLVEVRMPEFQHWTTLPMDLHSMNFVRT